MNAIETLNHWGGRFADFALPMLVQSSLLIVVLFALDLVLRNRVRAVVRYALWMLVLIKLVLPPSFAAPTSLAYWLPQKKAVKTPPAPSPQFAVRYSDVRFDEVSALPTLPPPRAKLQFAGWLLLGWLATALALIAWLVSRSRSVVQTAARALPASESPEQLLDACLQQMGIKQRVRLKLSVTPGSPAVCGLWRPVILIPQQLVEKLSALQLRAVLLHELAHIKRSDVLVHYVQTLLQIIYWWHPLLWLANAQIRRVREQAVDEMVMIQMGVDAETYPTTLLEVAKLAFKRPMLALGLIGIVESKSDLSKRIHRLINRPVPKSARLGFTGLVTLLLAGAAFLPMARGQRTPYQPPRVVAEPGQQSVVVAMDVKFIEIKESELAFLDLGEPTLTEFNGHRAWALTPEQLNGVLQRALEQTRADVLAANRVTTLSGRQSQIQLVDIAPVEGTEIRVGPTCDLTPYVTGDLIDLAVAASVTERRPVDPTAPVTSVADAFLTNEVGTARVIVGDGGGAVLENPEARSSKGNRYLVIVSATIVSADRAAESLTLDPASTAATGTATQKQEAPYTVNVKGVDAAKESTEQRATGAGKSPAIASDALAWTRTYVCGGFRLKLDADGTYLVSREEEGVRRSERGTWKERGQDFVLERQTGDLQYAVRRLRVDERHPSHLLWVPEVINPVGAIDYFSFKPADEAPVNVYTGTQNIDAGSTRTTNTTGVAESNAANREKSNEDGKAGDSSVSQSNSSRRRVPVLGDLPFVGRFFRSEATPGSLGRQRIQSALNRIVLPQIVFDNMRLPDVLQWLSSQARERDPEGKGINFIINPSVVGTALPTTMEPTTVDPITGKPITLPPPAPLDMSTVVVRIKPHLRNVRLADAVEAIVRVADKPIRYSIEDFAVVFSQKLPEAKQLEMRIYRIRPEVLREGLHKLHWVTEPGSAVETNSTLGKTLRAFFQRANVKIEPPRMYFYSEGKGTLFVRAEPDVLESVQKAIETLLPTAPRQILIEARFIEASTDFLRKIGLDAIQARPGEQGWARIFTAAEARALLQATTKTAGVKVLSAPRVTTLEGRQAQIRVAEVMGFASEINPQATNAPGLPSTNRVEPSPYLTSSIPVGPTLNILPEVTEDGYTLRVLVLATMTEFLGYDSERAEANQARVWINGKEQDVALPLPRFRTRHMQATANLYDGQTLVIGSAVPVVTTEQPNGKSEAKTVAEDDKKRLLVVVTPVLIDPSGNRIHAEDTLPYPADKVPPQPSR